MCGPSDKSSSESSSNDIEGNPVMSVRKLNLSYVPEKKTGIAGLDCVVNPGSKVILVGANGAGKSTLIRILTGLIWTSDVEFDEFDINGREKVNDQVNGVAYLGERWKRRRTGFDGLSAAISFLLFPADQRFTASNVKIPAVLSLKSTPYDRQMDVPMNGPMDSPMQRSRVMQSTVPAAMGPGSSLIAESPEVTVQGGSLKTWAFSSPAVERVQVILKTEGRPLDADVAGPDNTPHKMRIYVENGAFRPFSTVMETPRGPNTIAVRNIGQMEFPMAAQSEAVAAAGPLVDMARVDHGPMTIQGGALRTYPFDPQVDSVQVLLRTDGRPLNARIELLQGPNNNKQVIELYTEDRLDRPFFAILETPGSGNEVRIVNTAIVEFPLTCSVGAFKIGNKDSLDEMQPVISGYGGNKTTKKEEMS